MYPTKGANDSFKNFDNISNGGHQTSLSPLAYMEGQGSPGKSASGTNTASRGGRLLEPLFGGQQNRVANPKHFVTKSGGLSALTQHQDEGEYDS